MASTIRSYLLTTFAVILALCCFVSGVRHYKRAVGTTSPTEEPDYTDYMPTRGDLPDISSESFTQYLAPLPRWTPAEMELAPELIEEEFQTTYPALDRRKLL